MAAGEVMLVRMEVGEGGEETVREGGEEEVGEALGAGQRDVTQSDEITQQSRGEESKFEEIT